MLRKKALNRIILTTLVLFIMTIIFSLDLLSDNKTNTNLTEVEYVSNMESKHLYLLNDDNYLVKVDVYLNKNDTLEEAKEMISNLSVGNKKYSKLKGLIPTGVKVNKIELKDGILHVDFNSELLKVEKDLEEKVIESIVFSLLELDNVMGIKIFIDGSSLTKLEKNNISLPVILDESIGINKEYSINSLKNTKKIVLYYVSSVNDHLYYVPVTKYVNSKEDKVKIIIDNLRGNYLSHTNLSSYLNAKINVKSYDVDNEILTITFDSLNNDNLEEVTYSLASSIFESMDIKKVIFQVDDTIVNVKIKR